MSRFLAIDLDPQGLFVVAGTARGGAARVDHALAWTPGAEHGPPALAFDTAKAVGEGLRDRLKAAGIAPAPVLVAVGRDKVILRELRYPPVPPAEEPAVVRFQALKELTESPDDILLDYAPVAAADPAAERRAMAVVVRKDVFESIQAMCAAAGLKLAAVTPRPYAAAAGLTQAFAAGAAPPLGSPADAAAVLTLGPQGGEFTVVRNAQVAFTRSVAAQALVNEALLLAEVRRNLAVYAGQNPGDPVQAVYVAEADDLLGGWAGRLRAGLAVPVHAYDPLAGAAAATPAEQRGRFAGAAGLFAGRAAGLPINFASPRQAKVEVNPNRKLLTYAAAAVLLLLLVGGAAGYYALAAADDEVAERQREKAALEQELGVWEPDRKRLEAADQWEARGVNYLDELFDMSDRMPPGDTLRVSRFEGTAVKPDKNGKQDAQADFRIHVGAKTQEAVPPLISAIERDNAAGKFYAGTRRQIGGLANTNSAYNLASVVVTRVSHRPPAGFLRAPAFIPPRRGTLPAGAPTPAPTEPAEPAVPDDGMENP